MSHAYGEVFRYDRERKEYVLSGHFEYNGTCDVADNAIRDSAAEVHEHWRKEWHEKKCECNRLG